ncbi:hypothetical protein [Kushneria sinocarnis]|uniref:hypothetical protein n=1 Tax=Kushneria sinocarnis TaxID=595502 RepID=UPI0011C3C00E|nr:hypothetical protein [Kushneria sinocarnis]
MSDREMLECAAKAAGLRFAVEQRPNGESVTLVIDEEKCGNEWNPITNDGDAFRLIAELELNVFHVSGNAYAMPSDSDEPESICSYRDSGGKIQAQRRAITLAAARIGGYEG